MKSHAGMFLGLTIVAALLFSACGGVEGDPADPTQSDPIAGTEQALAGATDVKVGGDALMGQRVIEPNQQAMKEMRMILPPVLQLPTEEKQVQSPNVPREVFDQLQPAGEVKKD